MARSPPPPLPPPLRLQTTAAPPRSEQLEDLELLPIPDWAGGLRSAWKPGEAGARASLRVFLEEALATYKRNRDHPHRRGTSRLSPYLHFGEIGPRQIWQAVQLRSAEAASADGGAYLRQLIWREFSYHLLYHFPDLPDRPLRPEFNRFPWRDDPHVLTAWQHGRTGYPIVDAACRSRTATRVALEVSAPGQRRIDGRTGMTKVLAFRRTGTRDLVGLLLFLSICLGISGIGGAVTATSVGSWYQDLRKPSFNPPDWVFAPVWTALYVMIAVAGWRVWRAAGLRAARTAFAVYAFQLTLNLAWSFLFFGSHLIGAALIEIVVLLLAIIANTILFWRHDPPAGMLLVAYCAWVAFAGVLNAALWRLN